MSEILESKLRAALPALGSVVSFALDSGWEAEFTVKDKPGAGWHEPVLGWAVIVSNVDYDGSMGFGDRSNYETDVVPVVMDEGKYALTIDQYLSNRFTRDLDWRLVRRERG